eukprot:1019488-Amphidinium_carterae.1
MPTGQTQTHLTWASGRGSSPPGPHTGSKSGIASSSSVTLVIALAGPPPKKKTTVLVRRSVTQRSISLKRRLLRGLRG